MSNLETVAVLTIPGNPCSWKNAKRIAINTKTGRPFITADGNCKKWMRDAITNLKAQWRGKAALVDQLRASYFVALGPRQHMDFDNSILGVNDALQAADVIQNDSQIVSFGESWLSKTQRNNPRCEVRLERLT